MDPDAASHSGDTTAVLTNKFRFNALLAWWRSDRDPWSLQTWLEYMLIELYDMGILDELNCPHV